MNDLVKIGIWVVVIGVAFAILWKQGYIRRFSDYILQTREELKKCTWPSVDELKGSTLVVFISIVLLGGFTVGVDLVFTWVVAHLT